MKEDIYNGMLKSLVILYEEEMPKEVGQEPFDLYNRLEQLIEAEHQLLALIAAGVDNWEGYEIAQEMMNG